ISPLLKLSSCPIFLCKRWLRPKHCCHGGYNSCQTTVLLLHSCYCTAATALLLY
ncbi:hypothetical protein Bpfe_016233, partial [Biomphalaria pfeifferi]